MLAITRGEFNLLELNLGVLLMIITAILWMLAHSLTKPILNNNQINSIQLVFIRNFLSGIILLISYFLFFPVNNIQLFLNPYNQIFFISMALCYGIDLIFWYTSLKYLDISFIKILP